MKAFLLCLGFLVSSYSFASFTTINGIVLCNCLPKVDPECRSQCESRFYQSRFSHDDGEMCQCC
jgi:hypothetical protein